MAPPSDEKSRDDATEEDEPKFLDYCSLTGAEMRRLATGTPQERSQSVVSASSLTSTQVLRQQPMTLFQEASTVLFLAMGPPNGVVALPLVTYLVGRFLLNNIAAAFQVLGVIMLPLVIVPQPFVYERLHSWMAVQVVRYFSFRFVYEGEPLSQQKEAPRQEADGSAPPTAGEKQQQTEARPQILVAPPHGVFPYGNLLAMLAWPSVTGHHFQGLAANSALRVPVFKQVLRGMGVIDASRSSARRALQEYPYTIGISTGGVAEVFETNAGDECILLRERIGLIKLAIRTGSDLVPCYLFGNTSLLSCWAGEGVPYGRTLLEKLSRKVLGFALVFFYGRWFLPIPRRVPVLAVQGKEIPTRHLQCEEPDMKVVREVQDQLIDAMQELFDNHKHLYGWDKKHLIIK